MSRTDRDQAGGHPHGGYNKESSVAKWITRRKRRREAKRFVQDIENESKLPKPEKSTQGWMTW